MQSQFQTAGKFNHIRSSSPGEEMVDAKGQSLDTSSTTLEVMNKPNPPDEDDPVDIFRPPSPVPPVPYTTFTTRHKRLLTVILVLTMLASPLTATTYLPLLPLLASQFGVSMQAINLTITVYIVFQALSPLLFATASDTFGRRPIYLITYAIYTLASLGLALNKHS